MRFAIFLAFIFFTGPICGQERTDIPLSEALNYFQESHELNFSYNSELVELIEINFDYKPLQPEAFITKVEQTYPFEFEEITAGYYTLSTVEAAYELTVIGVDDGLSIPGEAATVLVNDNPIPSRVEDNRLLFSYKPKSSDLIELYVTGYEKRSLSIKELLNQQFLEVEIEPRTIQLDNLVIEDYLTQGFNLNPYDQSVSIATEDLPLVPGETDGDILASVTVLPGVTSPDSRAGNLYIRNSYVDQSFILYEGIPIYHRGHYFGTISPYNPKVIDEVKVYRSGFHPRLGGRVGGAIEIGARSSPLTESNFGVGLNSFYGMAFAKLPIKKNKLSFNLGVRHSYPGNFNPPKLQAISDQIFSGTGVEDPSGNISSDISTTFQDVHSKLNWNVNDKNSISLSGIFTRSLAEYSLGPGTVDDERVENSFVNSGGHLSWRSSIAGNLRSHFSLTLSDYSFKFLSNDARDIQTPDVDGNFSTNDIQDLGINEELELSLNQLGSVQFGVDYRFQEVEYDYKSDIPIDTAIVVLQSSRVTGHLIAPYTNFSLTGLDRLYLQLGLRATYYSTLSDFRVAPRISANYELLDWLFVKGAAGKYYQYLSQVKILEFTGGGFDNELWLLANENEGDIINGTQVMAGTLLDLNPWILDVEAYYKQANNVTYYPVPRLAPGRDFFNVNQKMMGVDFYIRRKINRQLSAWAGYTLSESQIAIDSASDVYYDDKFSQPHNLSIGVAFNSERWKISVGWRYASGLYGRPIAIQAVLNNIENMPIPTNDPGGPGNMPRPGGPPPDGNRPPPTGPPPSLEDILSEVPERFEPVHSLDISASYTLPKTVTRKWSGSIGVSLINTYNQVNQVDQVVRGRPPVFLERNAIQFAPNIMLMIEW